VVQAGWWQELVQPARRLGERGYIAHMLVKRHVGSTCCYMSVSGCTNIPHVQRQEEVRTNPGKPVQQGNEAAVHERNPTHGTCPRRTHPTNVQEPSPVALGTGRGQAG